MNLNTLKEVTRAHLPSLEEREDGREGEWGEERRDGERRGGMVKELF